MAEGRAQTPQEEEAIRIIRRWNDEGWTNRQYDVAYELISPDMVAHAAGQSMELGPAGIIELLKRWHTAFPDGRMEIDNIFAEGDIVLIQNTWYGTHNGEFYGIQPTGKSVKITSIGMDRVADGKVVEGWGIANMLGAMQQMGVIPTPGSS